jgi:hypothetical protein
MADRAALFMIVAFVIAFLPAIVANRRRHNSTTAIFIATLLLEIGNFLVATTVVIVAYLWMPIFTIAWCVCLVWSTTSNTRPREVVNQDHISPESPQERWQRMNAR